MDCSMSGFPVLHRILEWVAIFSSRGSSWSRYQTCVSRVSCISRWILYHLGSQHRGLSVQFSSSVMSDSLRPHGLQYTRLLYPSPTPRPWSNSCPSSRWCHSVISSSVIPFSSCLPSIFPSIKVFSNESALHIRWPSIGVSASTPVLPVNIQDWFPLGLVGSPCSPRDSQKSSPTPFKSINSSVLRFLYSPTLTSIHDYWKSIALTRRTFVGKVMSLLFNMLSRLAIAFLPRSKCLLISWLQSPYVVILEPKKIKSLTVSIIPPSICHEVMGLDSINFVFECWVLSQFFHSSFTFIKRL